jgi:iron complex transport system substrate-binding protein
MPRFFAHRCISFLLTLILVTVLARVVVQADDNASFPRTIKHALGETVLTRKAERTIALGWNSEDTIFALGEAAIAVPHYDFLPGGMAPWNQSDVDRTHPEFLPGSIIDFEKIATLKPDLILAIRSGVGRQDWKRLSQIAPTVVYRSAPWQAGWEEQLDLIGSALGKSGQATDLANDMQVSLQHMMAEHPKLAGRSFIFGSIFRGDPSLGIYLPNDPRVKLLADLGLRIPDSVRALAVENPGSHGTSVSFELLDTLDADLLIIWYPPGAREWAEQQPLFKLFAPVRLGRYVPLDEPIETWATSALTVRSIPYGMPQLIDRLAQAINGSKETSDEKH